MPKTYVPRSYAKAVTTQYGEIINVSFSAKELREFMNDHVDAKGYFKITIAGRREPDKFGNTHSVFLDEFQPRQQSGGGNPPNAKENPTQEDDGSGVPF